MGGAGKKNHLRGWEHTGRPIFGGVGGERESGGGADKAKTIVRTKREDPQKPAPQDREGGCPARVATHRRRGIQKGERKSDKKPKLSNGKRT